MKDYTIVDARGEILKVITVPDAAHLALNTPDGATAVDGVPPTWNCYYADFSWIDKGTPASPDDQWNVETRTWVKPALEFQKRVAAEAIDAAAGAARLRYITEAPGQQAVYLRKAEQSRAYRDAGYAGLVPPYVQAEANAMGITTLAAADRVLAIADIWDVTLSPAIEELRIGGKNAVDGAEDPAGVASALTTALGALAAV